MPISVPAHRVASARGDGSRLTSATPPTASAVTTATIAAGHRIGGTISRHELMIHT